MKFSIVKTGQTCLLVSLCVLVSACNPDEFFPIEEFLTGEDAYCYEAKDLDSCQARVDRCQPAFVEAVEDENTDPSAPAEMEFLVCIANPTPVPVDDGSTTGGTDGGTTTGGSDDGSTTGGTDGSTTGGTDGSVTGGTDGSTVGGTDGGTTTGGSDDGSTTGGSTGSEPAPQPEPVPTLEDALANSCQNLSSEYMWEKTQMKKGKVIGKTSKVKICHFTGNGTAHTIVIACPAIKAHLNHKKHSDQDDYLGACFY